MSHICLGQNNLNLKNTTQFFHKSKHCSFVPHVNQHHWLCCGQRGSSLLRWLAPVRTWWRALMQSAEALERSRQRGACGCQDGVRRHGPVRKQKEINNIKKIKKKRWGVTTHENHRKRRTDWWVEGVSAAQCRCLTGRESIPFCFFQSCFVQLWFMLQLQDCSEHKTAVFNNLRYFS